MPRRHRVALVTGAAHGIGLAIAKHLLREGWAVAALDAPGSGLRRAIARAGPQTLPIDADVAEENTAADAGGATLKRFGRLDALVSNAGMMHRTPLRARTLADWRRVLDVNLTATFLLARAAEASLRANRGAIVTIASTRAMMSEADTEAYSASKGGLLALSHALSISLAPDVRVNAVSPGWIAVRDTAKLRPEDHAQHPAGRVGKPQDIAEIAAFLLDGERAGFITGANFVIDGGMTRKMIYAE